MGNPAEYGPTLYGTATVGPKGQIVIPAEAREALKIKTGDKVIVMGVGPQGKMLALCPATKVESMLSHMTKRLENIREALDQEKDN
jgi:AbrB family looped-hinge helix DNA binding protein